MQDNLVETIMRFHHSFDEVPKGYVMKTNSIPLEKPVKREEAPEGYYLRRA
ncbi:hypothetical protein H7992_04895 [Sporosarcina sp. resist]|uniref:hypothetical protein n=1 Tax=Sporosarcina sp. resist TaxID=2762563 RepID=UPI00164D68A7|nr:hypothetical protein [Sporosarcina sp. resist]QNK89065.1 hypothetical protein H7992_04895 [Sporosarcina sp. resist]